jgi:hypothetical protein
LGNGDGTLQKAQLYLSGGKLANGVAAADVNGDQKVDVIVVNELGGSGGTGVVGVLLGKAKFATTTSLTSSLNPSVAGQPVSLTATVTSLGWIMPTGQVKFANGGAAIGSRALRNGIATLTTSTLPVGTLSITATYSGDIQSYKSTSPVLLQVVNSAAGTP